MQLISGTALLPALWVLAAQAAVAMSDSVSTGTCSRSLSQQPANVVITWLLMLAGRVGVILTCASLIFHWYDSKTMFESDYQLGGRRVRAAAAAARPAARPAARLNPLHLHLHRMQQQWI